MASRTGAAAESIDTEHASEATVNIHSDISIHVLLVIFATLSDVVFGRTLKLMSSQGEL